MQPRIMFVKLKTGYSDNGPAWIARVKFSKSGRTVYFNGRALKRAGSRCISGNHYDLETKEEYWVSGLKKDGMDRRWAGSGKVKVAADALAEYLAVVGRDRLDESQFELCHDLVDTDIQAYRELENE